MSVTPPAARGEGASHPTAPPTPFNPADAWRQRIAIMIANWSAVDLMPLAIIIEHGTPTHLATSGAVEPNVVDYDEKCERRRGVIGYTPANEEARSSALHAYRENGFQRR